MLRANRYTYIAGSLKGRALKIGVANTVAGPNKRRLRKYAGFDDWKVLYAVYGNSDAMDRIERATLHQLRQYSVPHVYPRGQKIKRTREVIVCQFSTARRVFEDVCGPLFTDPYEPRRDGDYEFEPARHPSPLCTLLTR
jgi:hypothetical protein